MMGFFCCCCYGKQTKKSDGVSAATTKSAAKKQLNKLFRLTKNIYLPTTMIVCGRYWMDEEQRIAALEEERQQDLEATGQTERQLGQAAYDLLKRYPCLAAVKYRNYFDDEIFPRKSQPCLEIVFYMMSFPPSRYYNSCQYGIFVWQGLTWKQ